MALIRSFILVLLALAASGAFGRPRPSDQGAWPGQCGSRRYGFVLHGLWPQYAAGGYPAACPTRAPLTEDARALGLSVFPSEKLVTHQWRKHGSCSGLDPKAYFRTADAARGAIRLPPQFEPGSRTQETSAREVSRAIREHNPDLTERGIAVVCSGRELAEVRVCMSKELKPIACGAAVRDTCRKGSIRIPGVR